MNLIDWLLLKSAACRALLADVDEMKEKQKVIFGRLGPIDRQMRHVTNRVADLEAPVDVASEPRVAERELEERLRVAATDALERAKVVDPTSRPSPSEVERNLRDAAEVARQRAENPRETKGNDDGIC
jgi:hypothetical protein